MSDDLRVRVETEPDAVIVYVGGEVDLGSAPTLEETLGDLSGVVIVDLRDVTFLDSSGMGLLVGQRNRLAKEGGDLRLRAPGDLARRTLELTGLSDLLEPD
jgi:anti-sigma B factor antagonist